MIYAFKDSGDGYYKIDLEEGSHPLGRWTLH